MKAMDLVEPVRQLSKAVFINLIKFLKIPKQLSPVIPVVGKHLIIHLGSDRFLTVNLASLLKNFSHSFSRNADRQLLQETYYFNPSEILVSVRNKSFRKKRLSKKIPDTQNGK
jgi:hypothetical protein